MTEKFIRTGYWIVAGVLFLSASTSIFAQSAEQAFDERAIRAMQGRPAIDIHAGAVIQGSTPTLKNRLNDASIRNAAELIIRRNGIPTVSPCDGDTANCGKLSVQVFGICNKTDLVDRNDRLCTVLVRVQYLEEVFSSRSISDTVDMKLQYRDFCPVWEYPFSVPMLTTEKQFQERIQAVLNEALDQFSLYYLRANPTK